MCAAVPLSRRKGKRANIGNDGIPEINWAVIFILRLLSRDSIDLVVPTSYSTFEVAVKCLFFFLMLTLLLSCAGAHSAPLVLLRRVHTSSTVLLFVDPSLDRTSMRAKPYRQSELYLRPSDILPFVLLKRKRTAATDGVVGQRNLC